MGKRYSTLLVSLLLLLLAMVPRVLARGDFVTVDEAYHWFDRVPTFLQAVQQGDYASTNIVGHPGVTTMWLGAGGLLAHQHLVTLNWIPDADTAPALYRAFLRAPIGIIASLSIALAYPLLCRLLGQRIALLAALFWAGEPLLIAHAQLLHLDALVTSLLSLSLLSALVSFGFATRNEMMSNQKRPTHWGIFIVSAITGGLALLTKSPAIILLPMLTLIAFVAPLATAKQHKQQQAPAERTADTTLLYRYAHSLLLLLAWAGIAALVWIALWPFAWVDPLGAVQRVVGQAAHDGGSPHGWGNFFMGQAVDDPGLLFYPVVLVLRIAPWTMIGLCAAGLVALLAFFTNSVGEKGTGDSTGGTCGKLRLRTAKNTRKSVPAYSGGVFAFFDEVEKRKHPTPEGSVREPGSLTPPQVNPAEETGDEDRRGDNKTFWRIVHALTPSALGMLILFALLFLIMMSIPPKKFDRYILPIFPILDILAAYGMVAMLKILVATRSRAHSLPLDSTKDTARTTTSQPAQRAWHIGLACITAGLIATIAWYHPYEIAYYNPLLGGGATAVKAIPVGWGEGYEQAGTFISAQPDGCDRAVATWFIPVFRTYYACNPWLVDMEKIFDPGFVQYAVLYIDQLQRRNTPAATAYLQQNFAPLHTVRIHGIDYAFVYELPLPNEHQMNATFGDKIRLIGYDIDHPTPRSSNVFTLTLQWEPRQPMQQDYALFVRVLDAQGNQVAQIDVPPAGPPAPTSTWRMHSYASWQHPIPLPPDLPAGTYWISIGIYNPTNFARLPISSTTAPPPDAPDDGPDTLLLQPITLDKR
jgi:hypothetical protein